jgi:hypothetical protein
MGHFVLQRGAGLLPEVKFCTGSDDDIFSDAQPAKAAMAQDGALVGCEIAVSDNHHQVDIAVWGGGTPGVGAKQNNLLWLKGSNQSLGDLSHQVFAHGFYANSLKSENRHIWVIDKSLFNDETFAGDVFDGLALL